MNTSFVVLLIPVLYLSAAALRWRAATQAALISTLAAILATAAALDANVSDPMGLHLGLGPITALFFWLLTVTHLGLRRQLTLAHLDLPVLLSAAVAVPAGLLVRDAPVPVIEPMSTALRAHILLSLLAWVVLTLAAWQSIACALQSHRLRNHREPLFATPLMRMEQISFRLIGIGWALLVGGIATGFLFVENFLAQHLVHKAAFTIIATVLFGILLAGRALRGWRGDQALRWVLVAWVLLFVGYAGVKLILEYGLHRTWS